MNFALFSSFSTSLVVVLSVLNQHLIIWNRQILQILPYYNVYVCIITDSDANTLKKCHNLHMHHFLLHAIMMNFFATLKSALSLLLNCCTLGAVGNSLT